MGVLASVLLGVGVVWGRPGRSCSTTTAACWRSRSRSALPGLVGVAAGKRLGTRIPDRYRAAAVDALLSVVGTRLSWAGVTGP